jgi:Zinc knuckle
VDPNVLQKPQDPASSSEPSDSDSELSEDNDYNPDDPTAGPIRASRREAAAQAHADRKAKKRAAKAEAAKLAEARRRKEINLNKVSSISSGGGLSGRGGGGGGGVANIECHKCGKKGHMMRDCLQRSGGNRRGKRRMSGD